MNKNELMEIKRRLIALGLAGVMIGTTGCSIGSDDNEVPERSSISSSYSNVEDYYKYVIKNGEAIKLYNSQNVYLLFNIETYKVSEYIYSTGVTLFGGAELYDLESEEMLAYGDGINTTYNSEYFKYILKNNYQVCLKDVSDYVEGHVNKEYYSLDEIRELEPQIAEGLKIINSVKTRTK